MMCCTGFLLLAGVVRLHASYASVREGPLNNCGFGHYGSPSGFAQRLVETRLKPGVADWNIVVPMPPPCKNAEVTGVEMTVCDEDAPPDVSMSDLLEARVHRTGQLAGSAAVNVTVHCILPLHRLRGADVNNTTAAPLHYTDTRSTYEVLSNEILTKEETSYELPLNDLTSDEQMPTSSTASPPIEEVTTPQVESISSIEETTFLPKKLIHPKEKTPQSLKVTIKITPTTQESTEKEKLQFYDVQLPSLSYKETSDNVILSHNPEDSTPYIATPPRHDDRYPRRPGARLLHAAPLQRQPGAAWYHPHVHRLPPHYPASSAEYVPMPPLYGAMPPPYSVAPVFRPISWLSPRATFWHRWGPLLNVRYL